MIVGQGQVHHRADFDLPADRHGTVLDLVHTQDRRLRRVQDRGGHQRAIDAAVGDAEGAAGHFVDLQSAVAGTLAEIGDGALDLRETHLVGVAHHRHDQSICAADGDAHVDVVLVDDVVAVDLGVDGRERL